MQEPINGQHGVCNSDAVVGHGLYSVIDGEIPWPRSWGIPGEAQSARRAIRSGDYELDLIRKL